MNYPSSTSIPPQSVTVWERLAFLLGRLIIIFAMVYIPIIFYTMTWRHYAVPKAASFEYLVFLLAACWGVIVCGRRFIRSATAAPAAFFFMMVMITSLVAVNLTESWETIIFLVACMVFVVLIPKFLIRLKDFEVLAYLLGILCILVDIYALAQWFNWESVFAITEQWGIHRYTHKPVSFMGNENYSAEFLNIATPICFAMIFCHLRRPAELIFYTFVSLLNAITMLYIDCNASYMGFLVSIPLILILMNYYRVLPWIVHSGFIKTTRQIAEKWYRHFLIIAILILAVMATLVASTPNKVRTKMATMVSWIDVDGDNRPDGIPPIVFRLQCMDAAIRNIIDVPFFGIGAGNFKVQHPRYENQLERKVLGEETLARKVHNDHLYHAVEYGVFGLFGWYWLFAACLYAIFRSFKFLRIQDIIAGVDSLDAGETSRLKRTLDPYERDFYFYLQLGILGGLVTAIVSCAFGHTFVIESSAVTYWLMTGVCVATFQVIRRSMEGVPQPVIGTTEEPLTFTQRFTRFLPRPFRWLLFFAMVLPLGGFNLKQMVGEIWLRQGMLAHDAGRYMLTFYCFQNALKQYPYQMEIYYILGRYYIDAVTEIDNAAPSGDQGLQKLQQLGLDTLDRLKLLEYGIVALQTDLYMNPNYKWAHNNLGVLYDKLPNFQIANRLSTEAYNRVFQIDREQIFAHYNMGLGYMRKQEFDKAIDSLELALVVDPSKTEIYRFLAQCFIHKKDLKRAKAATDKYYSLNLRSRMQQISGRLPEETLMPIVKSLGTLDLNDKLRVNFENENLPQTPEQIAQQETMQEVKKALQMNEPELYRLYVTIANELFQKKENRQQTLDQDPSQLALDQEQSRLALDAIEKAEDVISVPQDNAFYWLFGDISVWAGDIENAIEKWEMYLKLQPDHVDIRKKLVNLYIDKQEFALAAKTFAWILQNTNATWADYLSYGRIALSAGTTWAQAFEYFKKSVELGGDEARKILQQDAASPFLHDIYVQDPNFQELLGPNFRPSVPSDQELQETTPDAVDLPDNQN
ncbi:MAG: hypothetical protein C4527_07870 [Candidatus Omnitrophota bacterium]|jgi:tetratricopeptide (TPR) repeat protein|nr:MAG: hypothetical protein C4527_07870 [Candidatus Omnitrophota bacterium]